MDKIEITVTLKNHFDFWSNYGAVNIYTFSDKNSKIYCWKTKSALDNVSKGDVIKITANVKGEEEYKGNPQIVLQRVKVIETISKYIDTVSKKQIESLNITNGDFIWKMEYRRYKEHYADCETIAGTYDKERKTIDVIIRAGRLKPSGTRGKHYSGYKFKLSNGYIVGFSAVSEENAKKQLLKLYPDEINAECVKIFRY